MQSIHHDGSALYVQPVQPGSFEIGSEILIRLRCHPNSPIQRILLRTTPDGEQEFNELARAERTTAVQWWQIRVRLTMPMLHYRFLIFTRQGVLWLNNAGLQTSSPTDYADFKILAGLKVPSWISDSVFYQIFPDRFADGDPNNNVQDGEFVYRGEPARARPWDATATNQGLPDLVTFFGGDLQGISQKLDYLTDLGINAIYLNPIFTSFSNHRYDVIDYFNVDPHLGGNDALVDLREKTRQRGIRLMLDIVPNHLGVAHPWFQEAQKSETADTAGYFTFNRHPDDYESWLGVKTLPKLNYQSARLREVMYESDGSVFRYWLKPPFQIDGWRIDVANMLARQGVNQLGVEVGAGIRQAVKETNPDAYLLGENFFDATHQLQGDFLDATMNYSGFSKPIWFWLSRFSVHVTGSNQPTVSDQPWPTQSMVESLDNFRAPLPWQIAIQQFNLLDSHDTPRIRTILNENMEALKLAVAFMFAYPGVPNVYYGDEIGLIGDGHHNRGTMPWDTEQWNLEIRSYYQQLIELRRTSPALIKGGFQWLETSDQGFAFLRDCLEEWLILVAQRGSDSRPAGPLFVAQGGIPDGTEFVEYFSGQIVKVRDGVLMLPEIQPGASIWQSRR